MKPVELVEHAIQNSTKARDVVFDGFGGSGTTVIACQKTGRVAVAIELLPKYCDVIVRRWVAGIHRPTGAARGLRKRIR
jgi:DNA modification methylase